ncbi:MAG: ABC transporter ATP-binding protein [Dehalococcoidales bacterium]|jgi:ATP-binding cassette subfamily B protein|nr:ABC transporter [Dehalococcoidales bacterium]MDP6501365.1 ABC transporter ATP-binding protein [Dehalococcoidales bacterium]MDP6633112.1 ABC transporter ATP-binding protein [Dehalococcoidales bacterium]
MRVIFRLTIFTKKYWGWLLLAFLALVASAGFNLIIPRMMGDAIDTALSSGERSFLFVAAGIIIGAGLLRGVAEFGNRFLAEAVSQKVAYDIRNAIFNQLQRLSFAYHDQAQTGQLMSRATVDVEAIRMFFGMGLIGILQLVIMLVAISVILLVLNWQLALLTLAFMPAIAWRAVTVSARLRPMWLRIQELMAALGTILEESLTGIRVVKAFSRQKEEGQKFADQAKVLYDEHISIARIQAFNMPLMAFLIALPTAVILWYGGRQVMDGTLTVGEVTQFILYVGLLVMPVRRLGFMANMVSRTFSSGQRIFEILDVESAVKEKPDAIELGRVEGLVSFENVGFSYDAVSPTVSNINFTAQPGELVALLGGSGSGKSTVASLVSRFYDVTGGRITLDGTDIRDVTLASLRNNIGISQQDIFLFSNSIKNNIAYGAVGATMEQIEAASKAAHLHEFIVGLPDGYETWVGERGLTLSGGEKQRLAIARTLLINPGVLILDDSMSSVDAETETLIRQALARLIVGRTTFIITHRLPIIKNADLILMLDQGQIIEMGKHDELMARGGLYYNTFQSQLLTAAGTGDNLIEE